MAPRFRIPVVLGIALIPFTASAHPGAIDAAGCHHDRKHGGYLCHAGRAAKGAHRKFVTFGGSIDEFSSSDGVHHRKKYFHSRKK